MKKKARISYQKICFFVTGIGSLLWFLIRVIPKPSRAAYPCMRAAAPVASGFVLYLLGLAATAALIRKSKQHYLKSRYFLASLFLLAGMFAGLVTTMTADKPVYANYQAFSQPANAPMGTAKGINPGRVVWIHNPDATNKNCTNAWGDGWFLTKNNNQVIIDQMISSSIQILTGETTDLNAWNAIFQYYNQNHGKGSVNYSAGEKILIKINATSGWSGNYSTTDLSKANNSYYSISETSPHVVLSVLRQLVNVVGVAQSNIYVGDPMKHIYKHCYELWHAEFPDVNYLDNSYSTLGRVKVTISANPLVFYSDRGAVLRTGSWNDAGSGNPVTQDCLYTVFEDVDYMINIPALKAHARAGITLFAKNHLGSQSREDAKHLHMGLVNPDDINSANSRFGMGLYRVQVDLMGHKLLGGKELFYLLDGLWACSEAVDPPTKWTSTPFNGDWTSSIFASQDPVAIESVAFDFLRTEYTSDNHPGRSYPQMEGVDDYLHQAADNANWPAGIIYDPENDGTSLPSLGVHEHWNNETEKQYSRNLGTGDGIELIAPSIWAGTTGTDWNTASNWWSGVAPGEWTYVTIYSSVANQPVIDGTTEAVCNRLIINPGASLTIAPAGKATINALTNNGTLNLQSDASGIASLKVEGTESVTGTNNIQLYLTGGAGTSGDAYKWHYISSPVPNTPISVFNDHTTNLAKYDESLVKVSQNQGWVAAVDGYYYYDETGNTRYPDKRFSTLDLGQGYAYYYDDPVEPDQTYVISGNINTSSVGPINLAYNSAKNDPVPTNIVGFNLIGNPYSCSLDWNVVAAYNSLTESGNISSAIYFIKDYVIYPAYVPPPGAGGTLGATKDIPPMQGFFVNANASGQTITLPASAKSHSTQVRFKGREEDAVPMVRLLLEKGENWRDIIVSFNEKAQLSFDGCFDAYSLGKGIGPMSLWTKLNGIDYAINGIPYPETSIDIPIGMHTETAGNFSLSSNELNGLENFNVTLKDKITNTVVDLKKDGKLSFSLPAGEFEDRFVLTVAELSTTTTEIALPEISFNIYTFNGSLNINLLSDDWNGKQGSVKITNLAGTTISDNRNLEFWKNSLIQLPFSEAKGIYIVEIRSGAMMYVGKVMIR